MMVDLFWIAFLGTDAVAAVGLAAPITGFLMAAVIGIPFFATQVIVGESHGKGDGNTQTYLWHGLVIAAFLSVLVAIVVNLLTEPALQLFAQLNPSQEGSNVLTGAEVYLRIFALGLGFASLSDTIEGYFIGRGRTKIPLYISVAAVGVNVVLDPLLILGVGPIPQFGIAGAAIATVSSFITGFVVAGYFLYEAGGLSREAIDLDTSVVRKMWSVGAPNAVQRGSLQLINLVIILIVFAIGGGAGIAIYTIGNRLSTLMTLSSLGLQNATQSLVSQNIGAGRVGRSIAIIQKSLVITVGILSAVAIAQWLFPGVFASVFVSPGEQYVFAQTVAFIKVLAVSYPLVGGLVIIQAGFNGAQRPKVSMVSRLVKDWVVTPGIILIGEGVLGYGLRAVYWAVPLSAGVVLTGLGVYYWYTSRSMYEDMAGERSKVCAECDTIFQPSSPMKSGESFVGDGTGSASPLCSECIKDGTSTGSDCR